jgi:hypothetical protein
VRIALRHWVQQLLLALLVLLLQGIFQAITGAVFKHNIKLLSGTSPAAAALRILLSQTASAAIPTATKQRATPIQIQRQYLQQTRSIASLQASEELA